MRHTSTIRIYGSEEDTIGVRDPHFLALGLGGTNMMSMLWSVALGRRAVGVEMRGDPFLGPGAASVDAPLRPDRVKVKLLL